MTRSADKKMTLMDYVASVLDSKVSTNFVQLDPPLF